MSSLFASRHSLTQMGMISSAFLCHRSLRLLLILASGRLVNGKQNFSINEIQRRGKPRGSRERTFNILRAKVLSQIKISSCGSRSRQLTSGRILDERLDVGSPNTNRKRNNNRRRKQGTRRLKTSRTAQITFGDAP